MNEHKEHVEDIKQLIQAFVMFRYPSSFFFVSVKVI